MKFVPAVARLFCLALPGSFLTMLAQNKGDLCILPSDRISLRDTFKADGASERASADTCLISPLSPSVRPRPSPTSLFVFPFALCLSPPPPDFSIAFFSLIETRIKKADDDDDGRTEAGDDT